MKQNVVVKGAMVHVLEEAILVSRVSHMQAHRYETPLDFH
jgi:hypothetical protein